MKRFFSTPNITEARMIADLLRQEEIPCMLQNEHSSIATGAIPFFDCRPEIWVREQDLPQAKLLLADWNGKTETKKGDT